MDEEKLRKQIGANIAHYRKLAGLTQMGLAEKLNYSDKAVSKWERGESVPDVVTLLQMTKLFDIHLNDLVEDPNALPESTGTIQRAVGKAVEKTLKRKADKRIILGLCSVLVWFVALLTFVVLSFFDLQGIWVAFVYAIPVNAIVLLSLRSAWRDFHRNKMLISVIMWGSLMSVVATFMAFVGLGTALQLWRLFLLGIPGQIAILLWFRLFRKTAVEENHGQE